MLVVPEPETSPDNVIVWLPVKKAEACCPSTVSASNPEPEPSTVLILVSTSAAVYDDEASFASKAVCNPSTLLITWLCESSATVTDNVALPRFVNVALPEASPERVSVGSAVAVVVILALPEPSHETDPVTAPVKLSVLAVVHVTAFGW